MAEFTLHNIDTKGTTPMTSITKSGLIIALWVFLFALTGCGKAPVAGNSPEQSQSQQAQKEISTVVETFLGAIRAGRDNEVFNLLSPKAREIFGRDRLPSVPASDTAEFRVDTVQLVSENEAQVKTTMVDFDENGQRVEDSLAWALRKTEEGWRIVGTAFVFVEGMEPVVVNFESREAIAQAEAQVEAQTKAMAAGLQRQNDAGTMKR